MFRLLGDKIEPLQAVLFPSVVIAPVIQLVLAPMTVFVNVIVIAPVTVWSPVSCGFWNRRPMLTPHATEIPDDLYWHHFTSALPPCGDHSALPDAGLPESAIFSSSHVRPNLRVSK
jgi:hypothetical protein